MTDVHAHAAYREGMLSFTKAEGRYRNPYPKGTKEHDIFERGWTQALKRTTTSEYNSIDSQQQVEKAISKTKALEIETAKAAYLKSKGR